MELASRPHRWPEMRKLQAKFFDGLLHKVTETETEVLKILGLPSIADVRHYELTDTEAESKDKFTLSEKQETAYKKIIKHWAEEILGSKAARKKQVEEDEAIYNYYMLSAFAIGAEKTLEQVLREAPKWMDRDKLRRLYQAASLDNRYLKAVIEQGGTRIKTKLAKDYITDVLRELRIMASNGENPNVTGRWLHRQIGEGASWYWNRIARSESALAVNSAFMSNAREFKVPYVEWSAAPTACVICMQFDGKRWKLGESPSPVESTHPFCLCNLLTIYVNEDQPIQQAWDRETPYDKPYSREEREALEQIFG